LGALSHAETLGVISRSRCLVLSSAFEGFPQVVLEAMALEKAVIASDVGGLRDMVIHGESGYLYPVDRRDLFCDFIMELSQDGARARGMGSRGLTKLRSEYSLDRVVEQYLNLYRSLFPGAPPSCLRPPSDRPEASADGEPRRTAAPHK
jgi:glycosyltransferase involved in cell wall biosynthesis